MTVYADVLFCVNLIIDFVLLSVTARLLKRRLRAVRLLLCAALGAAYSVALFFPTLTLLSSLAAKLLFSAVLTLAAFGAHSLVGYLKSLGVFYAVSFGFGGAVFGLYLLFTPSRVIIRNDVVYFDMNPFLLFLLVAAAYAVIWIISRFIPKHEETVAVTVTVGDAESSLRAFVDTGNRLCELISGAPVMIAEYDSVKRLIPPSARRAFLSGSAAGVRSTEAAAQWKHGYRLIPAYGAAGAQVLLPAFRPDSVSLCGGTLSAGQVFIAVTDRALSSDGRYTALVGPEMLRVPETKSKERAVVKK